MKIKLFKKISPTNKIFLLQNLSVMIKAGVPLADALNTLAQQTKNKKLKNILLDIQNKIKEGKNFSESLEPYQENFGELFVNMIRAGETSGQLDSVIKELHQQTNKDHQLMMKVRNALTYPVIIIIAMLGIGTFMMIFVLPNITNLFTELEVELPLPTRILIGVSNFTQAYGLWIVVAVILLVFIFTRGVKTNKGKYALDAVLLKIPIVSGIIKKINLARASRSLSSLIKTDITIIETLQITSRILGNSFYKKALMESAEQVKKGNKMADVFKNYPHIFPPNIIQMVSVGEETGSLDEVLENLAVFYEEEVYNTMENLPVIIEPVLMLLIGAGVAGIALAIMLPMQTLTQTI
ncbi:MAG: type II secretion system F family protein [Candidatus Buchananbacteria bacterium]|nr:type II secretion system F family protein [Candidatus Buchananbacteria bacterium]